MSVLGSVCALLTVADQVETKRTSPAWRVVEDEPGLPRVLLIGDSIPIGYTAVVRELLAGHANLHRAPVNCGPSSKGVAELQEWLGTGKWDVIHFNFGLHDIRGMPNGERLVSIAEYRVNLERILEQLRATGAQLIWAQTTPVQAEHKPGQYPRDSADVERYNAVAIQVMSEAGVTINDLNSLILPYQAEPQPRGDVHFRREGYDGMAAEVARAIQLELGSGAVVSEGESSES